MKTLNLNSSIIDKGTQSRAQIPKIGKKWLRMAAIYRRFASDYPRADFSDDAAAAMYAHESTGAPLPDPRTNGFALGKKWMDVTIAAWKEDILSRGLLVSELQGDDGYPDWFLERIGVLHLRAEWAQCKWWLGTPNGPGEPPGGSARPGG